MKRREALAWTLALLFGGAVLILCFTTGRYELHTWQGGPIRLDRFTGTAWMYARDNFGPKWQRISEPSETDFQPAP